MNRNWSNQKANPALKTKTGNKYILQIDKIQCEQIANRAGSYFLKGGDSAKSIMNKHKVKHHRNSDTKTSNRDQIRTTALERSVMNYWGGA